MLSVLGAAFYFFSFLLQESKISVGMSKEGTRQLGIYLTPQGIQDELLSCHHNFRFICIKFSKSPFLGDMNLLAARELELGPVWGLSHVLLIL